MLVSALNFHIRLILYTTIFVVVDQYNNKGSTQNFSKLENNIDIRHRFFIIYIPGGTLQSAIYDYLQGTSKCCIPALLSRIVSLKVTSLVAAFYFEFFLHLSRYALEVTFFFSKFRPL